MSEPQLTFAAFVISLASSAAIHFGDLPDPVTGGQSEPNLEGAAAPLAQSVRSILVDTSSDLRAQALAHDVRRVDAILFTHSHADHVFGLDDVRRYNQLQGGAIPCYGDGRTLRELRRMFSYI